MTSFVSTDRGQKWGRNLPDVPLVNTICRGQSNLPNPSCLRASSLRQHRPQLKSLRQAENHAPSARTGDLAWSRHVCITSKPSNLPPPCAIIGALLRCVGSWRTASLGTRHVPN